MRAHEARLSERVGAGFDRLHALPEACRKMLTVSCFDSRLTCGATPWPAHRFGRSSTPLRPSILATEAAHHQRDDDSDQCCVKCVDAAAAVGNTAGIPPHGRARQRGHLRGLFGTDLGDLGELGALERVVDASRQEVRQTDEAAQGADLDEAEGPLRFIFSGGANHMASPASTVPGLPPPAMPSRTPTAGTSPSLPTNRHPLPPRSPGTSRSG